MRILGVDTGLRHTGLSDGVTTWCIESTGTATDTLLQRHLRMHRLHAGIVANSADMVVIEAPFPRQMGHAHDRSGLWWRVVDTYLERDIPVVEVAPKTLKLYATGNGSARKEAMLAAAQSRMPWVDISTRNVTKYDRADALWLWALGMALNGQPVVTVSDKQAAALEVVQTPWGTGITGV